MKTRQLISLILVLALLPATNSAASPGKAPMADEAIAVIRQSCSGYSGPYPCYTSLAAWESDYGGIDFGAHPQGDLVAADKIAVAQIEGTWTQPDTAHLDLGGWTTDAAHYIKIFTMSDARHHGIAGTGYRLEILASSQPLYSSVAYLRVEGLEIYSHSAYNGSVIYLNPNTAEGVGEIHFSYNLIHGDGTHTAGGLMNYTCRGTLKAWDNIIYDVGTPGYTAGIQSETGTAYLYNNTIVNIISGFAIRADGKVIATNNLTDAPGEDFYGSFYPGSDFNASADDTAPGFHSRRNQTFTFVNRAGRDLHLASTDGGARNYGLDLSSDPTLAFADDIDGSVRSGGWDIGADETTGQDIVPPIRLNGMPSGTLPSDTTQVTLTLSTNESATCRYATSTDVPYTSMTNTFSVTGGLTYTQLVAGLHDAQTYTYNVKCQDIANNANPDDYAISFYIHSADAVPPIISNVQATQLTPYSAIVTWDTDEAATSQVEYGATNAYGKFTVLNAARAITHAVTLRGLDSVTAYHLRVRSIDIGDNESVSADTVFTTTALGSFHYVNQKHPQASDSNPGTEAQPWLTIQHAADVAQPGDTIIVYPGSYGRVAIHKGGTAGNYITYKGLNVPDRSLVDPSAVFDPHNPVQIPGNPSVNAVTKGFSLVPTYPSTVTIRYVRIENFEITRIGDASGRGGFQLQNTESVEIVRNFIHDLNPNPAGYDYIGIRGESHDNANTLVKDNTLYRVQGTGINIVGKNWIVEGNEVSHSLDANTDTGLEVGGDSDAVRFFGSGHVIRNNTLHDNLDTEQYGSPHIDCFQTFSVYPDSQFAYDILIEGNTCDRMGQMLMIEDSSETNGTGNKVHHITFRNNVFRRARAFAFNGGMADHFTFVNNVVAESTYGGFGLTKTPYLTVVNNIFYNNGSGSQINDNESKVGSVWDYNIHYPDFSWPPKQPEYDQHSLFGVEPGFLNSAAGDYGLRVDSPAIDRGMALSEFNYDKIGTSRPQIAAWDIGAYEAIPEVALYGAPANQAIYLTWQINTPLPVTSTWRIDYVGQTGTAYLPITGLISSTRAYSLTSLTNYTWYTVTLSAMLDSTPFLSDTVRAMPTDRFVYMPLVLKN
jgi:hypothetical protein